MQKYSIKYRLIRENHDEQNRKGMHDTAHQEKIKQRSQAKHIENNCRVDAKNRHEGNNNYKYIYIYKLCASIVIRWRLSNYPQSGSMWAHMDKMDSTASILHDI